MKSKICTGCNKNTAIPAQISEKMQMRMLAEMPDGIRSAPFLRMPPGDGKTGGSI
jgi:hypothetical protein